MNLAPAIAFWKFGSLLGLELPKWEFIWEYEGSFRYILFHFRGHEMWFLGFILDSHLHKPLLWSQAQG
jgi:hypothetical protein